MKGSPKKPKGMSYQEKWLWDLVVASWMGEVDSAQLRQLCTLWDLLHSSLKAAKADPIDKDARLAVSQYAAAFDRLAAKFGLNPADRARLNVEPEQEKDEEQRKDEQFFGVVG